MSFWMVNVGCLVVSWVMGIDVVFVMVCSPAESIQLRLQVGMPVENATARQADGRQNWVAGTAVHAIEAEEVVELHVATQ